MLAITNQEDANHKKDAGTSTKSIKRSLFQDEPAESKKQKGECNYFYTIPLTFINCNVIQTTFIK